MHRDDPSAVTPRLRVESVIKKIPGKLPLVSSREKEGYLESLSIKSSAELNELLERQEKVLSNKFLVSKLTDKGFKATELKERIEKELRSRCDVDNAASLLAEMSIGQLHALEWSGHCHPGYRTTPPSQRFEGADYEETDPLKIIASHSGTTSHKKLIRVLESEESLVKPQYLPNSSSQSIEEESNMSMKSNVAAPLKNFNLVKGSNKSIDGLTGSPKPSLSDDSEQFAQLLCKKYGHRVSKDRFMPNKALKPFTGEFPIHPPGRVCAKINRAEETNVTPPIPQFGDTKLLSLEESFILQRQQAHKLKEVQMKHAAERLFAMPGLKLVGGIPTAVRSSVAYRVQTESSSESGDDTNEADVEDQEVHDDDERDNDTAVVYNIVS